MAALAVTGGARADAVNPVVALPKTNQIGFAPDALKRFVWTVDGPAAKPVAFAIERGGREIFRGMLDGPVVDQTATAGEYLRVGDFSAVRETGTCRIAVNGTRSHPFVIGEEIYRPLLHDAARAFHLIRANAAIDDAATGVRHRAGHPGDSALLVDGARRDLSGGWYNAADFGKWVHMAALSVSHMMWLFELRPQTASLPLDVPAVSGLPDLLAEARWGLEWMAKMQNADGSVLHKVDSEPNLPFGMPPADDNTPRAAKPAGSWDAAVFVAAMLQAARVFAPFDAAFAGRCKKAAGAAWQWLQSHPAVANNDPYYAGSAIEAKWLWALGEIARVDPAWQARAAQEFEARTVVPSSWMTPQILGALALAHGGKGMAREVAIAKIAAVADAVIAMSQSDAYGYSGKPQMYYWGSVENALNAANACFMAEAVGAGAQYRNAAARILDYVFGCNALGQCFVTGHGSKKVERPWHWIYRTQGIAIPGWATGGPNCFANGADEPLKDVIARGTPPAKCYLDLCSSGSWASNEGQTSENAALLFAAGMGAG